MLLTTCCEGDDKKIESVSPLEDEEKEPKAVDSVSEQLEKLNVGTESEGTKSPETQNAGDTAVTSTSS